MVILHGGPVEFRRVRATPCLICKLLYGHTDRHAHVNDCCSFIAKVVCKAEKTVGFVRTAFRIHISSETKDKLDSLSGYHTRYRGEVELKVRLQPHVCRCQSSEVVTYSSLNKYVRLRNTRTEIYAGRVVCWPLESHVSMRRAPISLEKQGTDGLTDAKPLHYAYRYTQPT